MESDFEIIEKAIEMLRVLKYEPEYYGYFVKQDDCDMGNSDYCRKCIPSAVKAAKKFHLEQRQNIISKYQEIYNTGFYKGVDIWSKYSKETVDNSKEKELEEYPEKAKFTYECHDPDFGGGSSEPLTCEGCGKYFYTNFTADEECAKSYFEEGQKKLSQSQKWCIWMALSNYDYSEDKAKEYLLKIAKLLTAKA